MIIPFLKNKIRYGLSLFLLANWFYRNFKFKILNLKFLTKGFIVPFSVFMAVIILFISMGISGIILKQIFFSKLNRESSLAYYAADVGLECALSIDNGFVDPSTGIGIFPYDTTSANINNILTKINEARNSSAGTPVTFSVDNIKCANIALLNASAGFTVTDYPSSGAPTGKTSTFNMSMTLDDGTLRCAVVSVNKTQNWRQVISRGYNTCDIGANNTLERAVVSETENL